MNCSKARGEAIFLQNRNEFRKRAQKRQTLCSLKHNKSRQNRVARIFLKIGGVKLKGLLESGAQVIAH